jgi:hypothetical protein
LSDLTARLQAALAGRYTIERELGGRRHATAYLATDLKHDRPVAVLVMETRGGMSSGVWGGDPDEWDPLPIFAGATCPVTDLPDAPQCCLHRPGWLHVCYAPPPVPGWCVRLAPVATATGAPGAVPTQGLNFSATTAVACWYGWASCPARRSAPRTLGRGRRHLRPDRVRFPPKSASGESEYGRKRWIHQPRSGSRRSQGGVPVPHRRAPQCRARCPCLGEH